MVQKHAKNKASEQNFEFDMETVIGMTNKNREKKDAEEQLRIKKENKKRKKKIKKIKKIIKRTTLFLLIVGGSIFALTSPIFNITQIDVLNNEKVSDEIIISLSGITSETNIFRFFSRKVEKSIEKNPYINNVKISRKFPNKIEIEVEEREARFAIPILDNYVYISSQGYILEVTDNTLNLPVIYGLNAEEENLEVGIRLKENDLESLQDVLDIMNSSKELELYEKITSIDISDKTDYIIYIEEENKNVHLGTCSNLSNKMLYIVSIMEKNQGKEGVIYVNGDLNKGFQPYFRETV